MQKNSNIECPKCHYQFDVTDSFKAQVKEEGLVEARKEFTKYKKELEAKQNKIQLDSEDKLQKTLHEEKIRLKSQLENEHSDQFQSLQNELDYKSKQLQDFNKAKAEIGKLKRENSEIASKIEVELQEKLTQQLLDEKEKLRIENENHNSMKLLERDTIIEQQKQALADLQVKLEQGSTQLQGEVQELAIEKWLKEEHPFDQIDEVKKGVFGADIIQKVHTRDRQNCGIIAYESKRTANWGNDWIEKIKGDMKKSNATVGVIVSSVLPKGLESAGVKDEIWICRFNEFKIISKLLRQSVIDVDIAVGTQKNAKEKMEILYDYIFGKDFKTDLNSLMDIFVTMQTELSKEKTQTMNHWKKRERHLNSIIEATSSIGGNLKGIAGFNIPIIDNEDSNLLEH